MITYEQISALLNQAQTINDELRKATIDVLTQLGATNEQNAFSFEPAEYGETPCFYSEGHYGPIELFVTKIWFNQEDGLMAILQIVNDDESWTQNLEELSVRVPYEDILYFMNLGDGKLPNSNETEEQPTGEKKDTSRGGLIDWRTRIR